MGDESKDMLETPQIMDIGVQFKPILNVLPKTGISSPILITDPNNTYLPRGLNPEFGVSINPRFEVDFRNRVFENDNFTNLRPNTLTT